MGSHEIDGADCSTRLLAANDHCRASLLRHLPRYDCPRIVRSMLAESDLQLFHTVHPIERRRPKISVQDLRRDLREADEDRYRLLVRTGDWRHPRIGVQEIRRQLREADEDRFRLTMRVRRLVTLIKRAGIGVCLLLVAGAASALWTADPPAPQVATTAEHGVPPPPTAPPATVADQPVEPLVVKTTVRSATRRRPPTRVPGAVSANPAAGVRPEKTAAPRQAGPRPLHPGEFGRRL